MQQHVAEGGSQAAEPTTLRVCKGCFLLFTLFSLSVIELDDDAAVLHTVQQLDSSTMLGQRQQGEQIDSFKVCEQPDATQLDSFTVVVQPEALQFVPFTMYARFPAAQKQPDPFQVFEQRGALQPDFTVFEKHDAVQAFFSTMFVLEVCMQIALDCDDGPHILLSQRMVACVEQNDTVQLNYFPVVEQPEALQLVLTMNERIPVVQKPDHLQVFTQRGAVPPDCTMHEQHDAKQLDFHKMFVPEVDADAQSALGSDVGCANCSVYSLTSQHACFNLISTLFKFDLKLCLKVALHRVAPPDCSQPAVLIELMVVSDSANCFQSVCIVCTQLEPESSPDWFFRLSSDSVGRFSQCV